MAHHTKQYPKGLETAIRLSNIRGFVGGVNTKGEEIKHLVIRRKVRPDNRISLRMRCPECKDVFRGKFSDPYSIIECALCNEIFEVFVMDNVGRVYECRYDCWPVRLEAA